MAKEDDDIMESEDLEEEVFDEEEGLVDGEPDDLLDDEDVIDDEIEVVGLEDAEPIDEEEAADALPTVVPKKKSKKSKKDSSAEDDEEDEDEELVGEDDVEADLGVILEARIKGSAEDDEETAEEEEEEDLSSSSDPEMAIQPKRADERLCSQCFLLVRKGAPMCPVGDDTCPLFT